MFQNPNNCILFNSGHQKPCPDQLLDSIAANKNKEMSKVVSEVLWSYIEMLLQKLFQSNMEFLFFSTSEKQTTQKLVSDTFNQRNQSYLV